MLRCYSDFGKRFTQLVRDRDFLLQLVGRRIYSNLVYEAGSMRLAINLSALYSILNQLKPLYGKNSIFLKNRKRVFCVYLKWQVLLKTF